MIISCEKCKKKFEADDELIPNVGRFLQCGSCNHKWFFKVETNNNIDNKEFKEETPHQTLFESKENINDIKNENVDTNFSKNKKKTINSLNFLKKLIIFIITFITLILIIDTFKSPISMFIPNIDFILISLYETINDIFLFLKDLI